MKPKKYPHKVIDTPAKTVIIDIFNDPIFFSLRDVKIQFINNSVFDNLLNIELKTLENLDYISIKRGVSIRNVTHIRINLKKYFNIQN